MTEVNDEMNTLFEAEKGATSWCEKEANAKIKKLKQECLDIVNHWKEDRLGVIRRHY